MKDKTDEILKSISELKSSNSKIITNMYKYSKYSEEIYN